eukprot:TRINITY_DN1431_c0_g6_i2.p1 TRINITY_DN1431_c0_g6~~TRINITY_DN1431_c0_g6_i2.p1  ORF type:complete len:486 (+),score=97.83 TRINITY_DN1431_c0_g6_i2:47-1459(+)
MERQTKVRRGGCDGCLVAASRQLLFFFFAIVVLIAAFAPWRSFGRTAETTTMTTTTTTTTEAPPSNEVGYFLAVSDLHFDPASTSLPMYGADSPLSLINSSLNAMYGTLSDPDLIVITGDLTCHSYTNPGWVEAQLVYPTLASLFQDQFALSQNPFVRSPILAMGNNDLYPKYSAPPLSGSDSPWFANLTNYWPTLNSSQNVYQTFVEGGYYRVDPFPDASTTLTLLVIHTNWWSSLCGATVDNPDPADQFNWLQEELQSAMEENRTVWIIGHIPPGIDLFSDSPLWQETFVAKYFEVTDEFVGTVIKAQLFAHEHKVYFRMQSSKSTSASMPIQQHSSISPIYNNNPTYRKYTYNKVTYEILDYSDYYLDITDIEGGWKPLFPSESAVTEYQFPSDLGGFFSDGDAWWDFIERMEQSPQLYQTYINNSFSRTSARDAIPGNMTQNLCDFANILTSDWINCVVNGGPSSF